MAEFQANLVEQHWLSYAETVLDAVDIFPEDDEWEDCKHAFYAGMYMALSTIRNLSHDELTSEAGVRQVNAMVDELNDYLEAV